MLDLDVNATELLVRAVAVYCVLLLLMRVSGRRTVGQFTPFDLLVVMLIGEAASSSMTGADESLAGGLLVCVVIIALDAVIGFVTARVRAAAKLFEGEAVLLGRDGKVFEAVRKKHRLTHNDVEKALRQADCSQQEMACLFLESDGSLTVQKRHHAAPTSDI